MAEEERIWRQRHNHELSTLTYGTYGTVTYQQQEQLWTFLKEEQNPPEDTGHLDTSAEAAILELSSSPETVVPAQNETSGSNGSHHGRLPSLAATAGLANVATRSSSSSYANHAWSQRIAIGSAVWLGVDGVDSGNLSVPVVAYTTGNNDKLRVACVGRTNFESTTTNGVKFVVNIPSFSVLDTTDWAGIEQIQQIIFSSKRAGSRSDTYLAVRLQSQTCLFEPLLRRDAAVSSAASKGSLGLNQFLTLPVSATGDHTHADVTFDPHNHRRLAIIDIEGNWSIWTVHGKRVRSARVLHQARLRVSGKIFSWRTRKRPDSINLYFDGWHQVLWTSSDGTKIDRLLVCNRQDVKVFDLYGDEVCSVNVRFNPRKAASYVLGVKAGYNPNLVFILTTSQVLLFDISRKDWKGSHGPALLSAWQHFHNASDMSLNLICMHDGNETLLILYSSCCQAAKLYRLQYTIADKHTTVTSSSSSLVQLPDKLPPSRLTTILLARVEVDGHGLQASELPAIAQMILQYEDLSILSINAVVQPPANLPTSVDQNYDLRLPPTRGLQHRSGRFIDEIDDDDNDLTGFVVADDEVVEDYASSPSNTESPTMMASLSHKPVVKDISAVCTEIDVLKSGFSAGSRHNMSDALSLLHERLRDGQFLNESSQALLLSELTADDMRVENVDTDSATFESSIHMLANGLRDKVKIEVCRRDLNQPLVIQYEKLFDNLVKTLPSTIPDRSRVQRERLVREIALDQLLANQTIRKVLESPSKPVLESQSLPAMASLVLNDPIQHDDLVQRSISATSASQPQPQLHKHEAKEPGNAAASPLLDVINRLSVYTELQKAPPPAVLEDDTTSSQTMSLLAHLPKDARAVPENYDWQAVELALAVEKSGGVADRTTAKDRTSERLARARRRADRTASNIKNTHSTSVLPDSSHALSPVRDSGLVPLTPDTIRTKSRLSNTQPALIFSDGFEQTGSSSQANQGVSGLTSTQPVSGAFGSRSAVHGKVKARKKKRVAGF